MFPALYNQEHPSDIHPLTQEQLTVLYNDCIRPAVAYVRYSEVAHWPVSYDAEFKRLSSRRGLGQSTYPISTEILSEFGEALLENLQALPWGAGAFFFHQIRGIRAVYQHEIDQSDDTLQALLDAHFIPNSINTHHFWVDVGMEFMDHNRVLWWRADAHWRIIQQVLNISEQDARRAVQSARYSFDAACQLSAIGGCRFVPTQDHGAETGTTYIQLYNTEKQVTYAVNNRERYNSKHLDIADAILDAECISSYFHSVHTRFKDARRNFEGYARLEVRLPLRNANHTIFNGSSANLSQSLVGFKNCHWW